MAYPNGFSYVKGPVEFVLSTLSSTCTVRARNPVTVGGLGRTIIEAASTSTTIYGIAVHDAADSIYPGKMLVEIPTPGTVYATKIQTGVATSLTSAGQAYGIEKSGNYLRLDADSAQTALIKIVPRGDYTTVDSTDSSVYVQFLGNALGVFHSNASVTLPA